MKLSAARLSSTIARRLDSLGALTRGERRTAGSGLFRAEDNLESPWTRRALLVFYGALAFGELDSMTLETFMVRTSLKLLDDDGGLKPSDDLPPIHTFLNRLLALRIADQNALFADFDRILSGILDRAAASGELDRGLEDIEAEELEVMDQEVIRTDVSTGAETARRVRAPDGRRWLGRVLDQVQAQTLKTSLGLTDVAEVWADGARTAATILDRNVQLSLEGGLWLKRSRVMDRWRIEVVGGRTDRDALVASGCFVEIIAFTPRVFVPVDRPTVLEAVLRRHPVQTVLDGQAA